MIPIIRKPRKHPAFLTHRTPVPQWRNPPSSRRFPPPHALYSWRRSTIALRTGWLQPPQAELQPFRRRLDLVPAGTADPSVRESARCDRVLPVVSYTPKDARGDPRGTKRRQGGGRGQRFRVSSFRGERTTTTRWGGLVVLILLLCTPSGRLRRERIRAWWRGERQRPYGQKRTCATGGPGADGEEPTQWWWWRRQRNGWGRGFLRDLFSFLGKLSTVDRLEGGCSVVTATNWWRYR